MEAHHFDKLVQIFEVKIQVEDDVYQHINLPKCQMHSNLRINPFMRSKDKKMGLVRVWVLTSVRVGLSQI